MAAWSRLSILGAAALAAGTASLVNLEGASAAGPQVLRVGTFHGTAGQYRDIQTAVSFARPGDWVLVAPGDYHSSGASQWGVYITTPRIHLRGMDRNTTIVDGTSSAATVPCDPSPAVQTYGPPDGASGLLGRNGIEIYKASGVSVENLTACNFLSGSGHTGNQIWWNGGDGSGTIGLHSFEGRYLTASSSYFKDGSSPMAMYGIFTSNENGPGIIDTTYASNMGDSDYYIGACPNCNAVLTHAHAQNSALGFSGTNAGGHLLIEHSEFDHNRDGVAPNSLNNDDAPPPQSGLCPGSTSTSCTFVQYNSVHDNNNPSVPASGITANTPIGTGIEISGGNWDTVRNNTVYNQGGWGILLNDFPDSETPPPGTHCQGGTQAGSVCYFNAYGNAVLSNTLFNNGGFGNPTNSDLAAATAAHNPGNCFVGNREKGGGSVSSDPPDIQTVMGTCGKPNQGDTGPLVAQLNCASGGFIGGPGTACPPGSNYPTSKTVTMLPIPTNEVTMPNPCTGVPANPWCPRAAGTASTSGGAAGALVLPVAGLLRRRSSI